MKTQVPSDKTLTSDYAGIYDGYPLKGMHTALLYCSYNCAHSIVYGLSTKQPMQASPKTKPTIVSFFSVHLDPLCMICVLISVIINTCTQEVPTLQQ